MDLVLSTLLLEARRRLVHKGLFAADGGSLSLRLPRAPRMLVATGRLGAVECRNCSPLQPRGALVGDAAALHAAIYALRPDVGAIVVGGAAFGHLLADFGGAMPLLFDEQARHLGRMRPVPAPTTGALEEALLSGGNALVVDGVPLCLGTTLQRMVFNAELFEKCAKAWVLAAASGQPVSRLPWWVGLIANGRLLRDERRAVRRFARGLLPEDVRGY
jgi:ribulose-5-phosphate 4-epimerase/fuculose-1-phosphate aldolase